MLTLLIVSLLIFVSGFAFAAWNMYSSFNAGFSMNPKSMFAKHFLAMVVMAFGALGALVSGITLIVRAFKG